MNDTVVVFDRMRENLRANKKKPLREIINSSVNETLPRTIMTGTTTLGALLAMILLGGDVIRPFAMILTFGIIVGTFSSIWVAAPLVLWIEKKWPRDTDATPHTRVPAAPRPCAIACTTRGPGWRTRPPGPRPCRRRSGLTHTPTSVIPPSPKTSPRS
jgi:preprotein translocase subunit SecF